MFGRSAEQSCLARYEPSAPIEVSSETTAAVLPSRRSSLESNSDDLATLDAC